MGDLWPPPRDVVDDWIARIADTATRRAGVPVHELSDLLYREVHLGGTWRPPSGPDDELIAVLHNVLRNDRYVSPGWRPHRNNEVARDGVRLLVTEADIAERGETFAILLPRIQPRIALGRHVLVGAAGPPDRPAGRIYVNPGPKTSDVWSAMAKAADETGLAWRAAFRTDRSDRVRPDRIVLACDPADLGLLLDSLSTVVTTDAVPAFAYRRGPGLAVAIHPTAGPSFGRLIAERAAQLVAAGAPLTILLTGTPTDG